MSGGENDDAPNTTKRDRSQYQRDYYAKHKSQLEAKRNLRRQRTPRSCIACHNPFTPTYARQKVCNICAAALNERFIPVDATEEEMRVFESLSNIAPRQRKLLSAGFAKKKHIIETMLRSTIAMYIQEAEAASWRLQYYEELVKHVRGKRKAEAQESVKEAAQLMKEAGAKLQQAQRNLEVHQTLQNDGKYFDKESGAVVLSESNAMDSPEDNYRKLLEEFEAEQLLTLE